MPSTPGAPLLDCTRFTAVRRFSSPQPLLQQRLGLWSDRVTVLAGAV